MSISEMTHARTGHWPFTPRILKSSCLRRHKTISLHQSLNSLMHQIIPMTCFSKSFKPIFFYTPKRNIMKPLQKFNYSQYRVSDAFNQIILKGITSYNGKCRAQLKSFFLDLQTGGCISGMITEFIYNADCKEFYIEHIDDLENIRSALEQAIGEPIENRFGEPHYTFMCWLCFEEYCFDLYSRLFE